MNIRRAGALALGGMLTLAASLHATVIAPMELPELVAAAPVVAHVRVVALEPQWTEGRRRIETVVTAEVEDALKGQPGREVTFRVPGGQIGPYRSIFVGAPRFVEGDEAVVFLNAAPPRMPHLVGLSRGAYRVARAAAGPPVVAPGAWTVPGDEPVFPRDRRAREIVPLSAFKQQVRALAAAGAAR